ncbi:type II toxin-antitoxin system prevent-host-death family antitoxin [Peptoniphilus sp. HCN-40583]|uniref:type II toxin-antitoxin system prevent-host-death family antitoxin n=1 Tax=Peptoniphilus sp. HCN-40583 TaxID=3134662 RepID=UPI0030BE8542
MMINTKNLISMTEANQNFSKVTRLVDETGSALILKNNRPSYVLMKYENFERAAVADDESLDAVSQKLMKKNRLAYEELAK